MALDEEDLASIAGEALDYLQDEQARSGGNSRGSLITALGASVMSDGDLESLRKRLPFLADFSDDFIRTRPMDSILKIETTSLKIKQMEQARDHEDRLAMNKLALESSVNT